MRDGQQEQTGRESSRHGSNTVAETGCPEGSAHAAAARLPCRWAIMARRPVDFTAELYHLVPSFYWTVSRSSDPALADAVGGSRVSMARRWVLAPFAVDDVTYPLARNGLTPQPRSHPPFCPQAMAPSRLSGAYQQRTAQAPTNAQQRRKHPSSAYSATGGPNLAATFRRLPGRAVGVRRLVLCRRGRMVMSTWPSSADAIFRSVRSCRF